MSCSFLTTRAWRSREGSVSKFAKRTLPASRSHPQLSDGSSDAAAEPRVDLEQPEGAARRLSVGMDGIWTGLQLLAWHATGDPLRFWHRTDQPWTRVHAQARLELLGMAQAA